MPCTLLLTLSPSFLPLLLLFHSLEPRNDAHDARSCFCAVCPVGSVLFSKSCLSPLSCPLLITPSTVGERGSLPPTPQQPSLAHSVSLVNMPCMVSLPLFVSCSHITCCCHICSPPPPKKVVCTSCLSFHFSFPSYEEREAGAAEAISILKRENSAPGSLQKKHACVATSARCFTPHLKRDASDLHVS